MEIKHPDMDYIPVKVKKAKIDTEGNIVYVDEKRKLPRMVVDAMSNEKDDNELTTPSKIDAE